MYHPIRFVSGKHLRSCYADGETITTDQDTCNKIKFNKSEIIPVRVSQNCDMIENRIHHHRASHWERNSTSCCEQEYVKLLKDEIAYVALGEKQDVTQHSKCHQIVKRMKGRKASLQNPR